MKGIGTIGYLYGKKLKVAPDFTLFAHKNSRWFSDLHVKSQSTKVLEEYTRKYVYDLAKREIPLTKSEKKNP